MTIGAPRIYEGVLPLGGGRVMGFHHLAGRYFMLERRPDDIADALWFFDSEEDRPRGFLDDEGSEDEDILPPPPPPPPPPPSDNEDDEEDGLDVEGEPPPTVRPLQELPVPPPEESAPSTSGLVSTAKRSREDSDPEQVSTKRQRWTSEESREESAPSTSGLGPSTTRSDERSYMDSARSTSAPFSRIGLWAIRGLWLPVFPFQDDDSDSD